MRGQKREVSYWKNLHEKTGSEWACYVHGYALHDAVFCSQFATTRFTSGNVVLAVRSGSAVLASLLIPRLPSLLQLARCERTALYSTAGAPVRVRSQRALMKECGHK